MADLPPWLTRDYDPIGTFMRAYQTGAQIRQEQTRLAEQQRQANMEAQARQQQLEQQALLAAVNNAVEQSYNNQRIQIDQQRLENERKRNADLAKKAVDDLTKPKINFSASGRVLSYDPVTGQVDVIREGEVKPTKQPTISPSAALSTVSDPLRQPFLESTFGPEGVSNLVNIAKSGMIPQATLPFGGTNFPPAQLVPPIGYGGRLPVISPDGRKGSVPANQIKEALAAGYKFDRSVK